MTTSPGLSRETLTIAGEHFDLIGPGDRTGWWTVRRPSPTSVLGDHVGLIRWNQAWELWVTGDGETHHSQEEAVVHLLRQPPGSRSEDTSLVFLIAAMVLTIVLAYLRGVL